MDIVGKRLSLILWDKNRNGEDEVWVHAGTVQPSGSDLVLDGGENGPRVKLLPEWLPRNKPVSDELRTTLLGAELCLSLRVGPIPQGADPSQFEDIDLRHPPDED
jgi:hypothetical protein